MNSLTDLPDYLRDNLKTILAVVLIILIALGDTYFVATRLLPEWRAKGELEAAQQSVQSAIDQAVQAQNALPNQMLDQIDQMQASLSTRGSAFLTSEETSDLVNRLFLYAAKNEVEIVQIQAITPPQGPSDDPAQGYEISAFTVEVIGQPADLIRFISRIEETRIPGVVIANLTLEEVDNYATLSIDMVLYTSDYTSGMALSSSPSSLVPPIQESTPISVPVPPGESETQASTPICDCSANLYDCRDFPNSASAQACYDFCGGPTNDIHLLDADTNGVVCQTVFP